MPRLKRGRHGVGGLVAEARTDETKHVGRQHPAAGPKGQELVAQALHLGAQLRDLFEESLLRQEVLSQVGRESRAGGPGPRLPRAEKQLERRPPGARKAVTELADPRRRDGEQLGQGPYPPGRLDRRLE
jgi:hypothetical protein